MDGLKEEDGRILIRTNRLCDLMEIRDRTQPIGKGKGLHSIVVDGGICSMS